MRLGTRGSALALAQAHAVAAALGDAVTDIVTITTAGDRGEAIGDKARWTNALERALLAGEVDICVHSAKDVPGELAPGCVLAAAPPRATPYDALVGAGSLATLPRGARVGTSSLRRAAQLRAIRDDLRITELRGNVDTRLRKLADDEVDALVLAAAGLERLGRRDEIGALLDELVPAPGQGVLALEVRADDAGARGACARIGDAATWACLTAERTAVRTLGATCDTPVGAHATAAADGTLTLRVFAGRPDGSQWIADEAGGGDPVALGTLVAERLLAAGAGELLTPPPPGTVYLVGAGPGDPGLMTVRGRELLASADVVLHDRLIPATALDGVRADAIVIDVGKIGGGHQVPQEQTNAQLLEHARAGRTVVRLKGGDPYVFGRGGEEAQTLRAAGIPYEVVPGVTAGVAAAAYAGIPVTFRGRAAAVAFITGHEDPDKPGPLLDWPALAAFPGTLVFYMGVRALQRIAEQLQAHGRAASEPVAVVERGTLPGQRTLLATLADVAQRAADKGIAAPAVTIVGPVAALREELQWLEARPLFGTTVAVTRARAQTSALAARLRALGAGVVEAPAIRIEPLRDVTLPDLAAYDLLCVTSPTGAELLLDRLLDSGRDARALQLAVAAIGPGTAAALRARGVAPDIVPPRAVAESLVEALAERPVQRALIARAREGRDVLPDALRARGAAVDVLALYRTRPEPLDEATLEALAAADYVTFASGSAVEFLLRAAGGRVRLPPAVSIGPATSAALRAHGIEPLREADPHTPVGLITALCQLRG